MKLFRKIAALFRKEKLDAEMSEEMRVHLELQTEENIARGMSKEDARYAALRSFGGVEQVKEIAREQRSWVWLEQLGQDLRHAVRQLRKSPGFAGVAVLSLGLGIGANTAIFSSLDSVLLKSLAVEDPDRLVRFRWLSGPKNGRPPGGWSNENAVLDVTTGRLTGPEFSLATYLRFSAEHPSLTDVFAFAGGIEINVNIDQQPESQIGQVVTGTYYTGLRVTAHRGRTILPSDDMPGAEPVVVISHAYWQARFGGDPVAVGKVITVNRIPVTIVGVMPPDFVDPLHARLGALPLTFPLANLEQIDSNLWGVDRPGFYRRPDCWWLQIMGRVEPGVTPAQAAASLEAVFQESAKGVLSDNDGPPLLRASAGGQGLIENRRAKARPFLVLMGLTALVLVAACTNLATLLLARGAVRRREIAVRLALGASRTRIVRQLLTESFLLAGMGAGCGVLFAAWSAGMLASDAGGFSLDGRVLAFAMAVTLLTGVGFGLAPALRSTRLDLTAEFQGGARQVGGVGRSRFGQALVVVQVAVATILLIGAGLFLRTLRNLNSLDVGFNRSGLLLFQIDAGQLGYKNADSLPLFERIHRRIAGLPGVSAVTFSDTPLLSEKPGNRIGTFVPGGKNPPGRDAGLVSVNPVANNFFEVTGMRLLLGRGFLATDAEKAPRVAVVNEAFVKAFFGDRNPVGRYYAHGRREDAEKVEIVGVVRDARYGGIRSTPWPSAYVPCAQQHFAASACFTVRCAINPASIIGAVRKAVAEIDPNLPLTWVRTQEEELENRLLEREHMFARLSAAFGGVAVLLACIGLYGLMSYSVNRRTSEIGLRMALGALPRTIEAMFVRESLGMVGLGLILGMTVAMVTGRFIATLLYDVTTSDPATFSAGALLLTSAALLAVWLPTRRAAKVDPVVALRAE